MILDADTLSVSKNKDLGGYMREYMREWRKKPENKEKEREYRARTKQQARERHKRFLERNSK